MSNFSVPYVLSFVTLLSMICIRHAFTIPKIYTPMFHVMDVEFEKIKLFNARHAAAHLLTVSKLGGANLRLKQWEIHLNRNKAG